MKFLRDAIDCNLKTDDLEIAQTLISGLQLPNFIFNCVKIFAESPAFDCKICLVKNKIFAVSPQNQHLNKRSGTRDAQIRRAFCSFAKN
jgi:hypothetical protein